MRIGLDIDGVMYKWDKTARYMLREVLPDSPYRSSLQKDLHIESPTWDYIQDTVSKEHWDWLWTEGVRLGLFRYGHLYPGTIQAVRALAEIGEVVAITHRPKQAVNDTLDWLSFQRFPLSGVHLLTNGESKASIYCDVYLDDKTGNVVDLFKNTCADVFLMRRPWNMDFGTIQTKGPGITIVEDWPEFVEKVKAL